MTNVGFRTVVTDEGGRLIGSISAAPSAATGETGMASGMLALQVGLEEGHTLERCYEMVMRGLFFCRVCA